MRLIGRQPIRNGSILVRGTAEDLGEAAATRGPGTFGGVTGCAADGGDPGAGCREGSCERGLSVERAGGAYAGVAGGNEDGDTAGAELGEEVAGVCGVGEGNGGFVVAVGDGEGVGERGRGQGEEVVEELDVGLVGVGSAADPLAASGCAVVGHGDGAGDATGVLDVEVGFNSGG